MKSSIVDSLSVSTTPSIACFIDSADVVDIACVIDIICVVDVVCIIDVILSSIYYSNVV
jgi:hypothetical protein